MTLGRVGQVESGWGVPAPARGVIFPLGGDSRVLESFYS